MRAGVLLLAALAGAGCARRDLFPMEVGHSWTVMVRSGLGVSMPEQMTVARELSVAGTRGFEISSSLGTSRLAWIGDTLYAESFPNVRFQPPLPILVAGDPKAVRHWQGSVLHLGAVSDGVATLSQAEVEERQGSMKLKATETRLSIEAGGREIEITSAYTPNIGLLRQRQTTDGRFDVALEYLGASTDVRR